MGISYLNDTISRKTFFTYFSEFERGDSKTPVILETVILSVVFIVAFCGNLLVITFIIRFPAMRQVTNYYITNLAVSDLVFSLTTPLVITTRITEQWLLTDGVCHIMVYVMFVCGINSVWTMVLISMDRYRSIIHNRRDQSGFKTISRRIGLVWVAALTFSTPIVIFFTQKRLPLPNRTSVQVQICTLDWKNQGVSIIYCTINFILVFGIPFCMLTRNYYVIMRKFNNSRRRMREYSQSGPQSVLTLRRQGSVTTTLREIRTITMLILMVTMFGIMWCPIILIQFFLIMDWVHLQSWHFIATLGITYLNLAMNPIVYGLLNEQYKKHFIEVFQKISGRCRCDCCRCNLCAAKGSMDFEMEDTTPDDRTDTVVTVCARALAVAGDVALGSNGVIYDDNNFVNPTFIEDREDAPQR